MALLKDGTRIYGNAVVDGSLTTASPDKATASSVVATTLSVKQLFASQSTSGTLDWNDVTNTRPGVSPTLLLASHTNGPGGGGYYHPLNIEYAGVNGNSNLTQLAIAYGNAANDLKMRGRYQGAWTSWVTFLNSSNFTSFALSSSTTSTQTGYFGDIALYDDSTPSHYLTITNSANLTAARTLSVNVNDANRTVSLSGDLTLANSFTTSGNFAVTLTATAATSVTLPTSGTLATTAGTLSSATNSTQSGYFGDIFLYDDSTPSHYLGITNSANLTAARTLSINVNDADRTISLSGNLTVSGAATISGTNTGDQTITLTGDVTGSGTGSFAATLANSGVTAGTYKSVTVDAKGRVTAGTNPTTLSGYGITDALTNATNSTQNGYFGNIAIQDDVNPSNYLFLTNGDDLTADRTLNILVNDANRSINLSGNLTLANNFTTSGNFALVLTTTAITNVTLPSSGTLATTAGTLTSSTTSTQSGYFGDVYLYDDSTPSHYLRITNSANLTAERALSINVNDADRIISLSGNLTVSSAATISGTNTGDQTITLTGDVTGSGTGSFAATLANSGVTAGTYKSVTVDAKGRVTAGTNPTTLSGYGITDALSNSTTSTQSGYFGDIFLFDDSTPSHYLQITNSANLTAARSLSINVNDANRSITLSGDLSLANSFTTSGNFALTLTTTAATNVTLPTSGTLATTGNLSQFASTTSAQLAGVISDETGSGSLVFAESPTLFGPTVHHLNVGGIKTGTYAHNGTTTITVTVPQNHGLRTGDSVFLDFTSLATGTVQPTDAYFNQVTVTNSTTFTVTAPAQTAATGNVAVYPENQIRFQAQFGDGDTSTNAYNHTVISERLYGSADKSELLIFKGNDSGTTIQDNIRLAATGDIYFHTGFAGAGTVYNGYINTHGNTVASSSVSILANGNVGIGFANPQKRLEAIGPASDFVSVGVNGLGIGAWTGIHFGYREDNALYRKSALVFERLDGSARGKIHILNNGVASNASATLADSKLTILPDGNVGINTTNPLAKLHVNAEARIENDLTVIGNVNAPNLEVYELDDITTAVNGLENTFVPTFNYNKVSITDPFRLLITINGIIQSCFAFNKDYVFNTLCLASKNGYTIDHDGNIKFTESLPMGSEVIVRSNPGSTRSTFKYYPFSPLDLMLSN